ncbi:hypothetical protein B0J17DRAFT_236443 [Rhizoctonia solani]|nr:hypothetical protein B0J17DRAFT_236443 [Rhizoctonia solani]
MDLTRIRSVDSLPIETLTQIFVLVCSMHLCPRSASYTSTQPKLMSNPVILSHVCSSWRHLAINSSSLWTHIDLIPGRLPADQLPTSIETYLARAGEKLLDIHINSSRLDPVPSSGAQANLLRYLSTLAPRAWGVTVETTSRTHSAHSAHILIVISTFFKKCVAGKLTHLSVKLSTGFHPFSGQAALTRQPQAMLEDLWLPVTVLRLRDFYPKWTSKAYHGLTELRMTGYHMSIPESSLIAVLQSSPKLRVLQISIRITTTPHQIPGSPILLDDLEVFRPGEFDANSAMDHHTLVRLVQPGPKPLTLLIRNISGRRIDSLGTESYEAIKSFLARSNVARLVLTGFVDYADLADLLALSPTIRALALERLERVWVVEDESGLPLPSTLDVLYVMWSTHPSPKPFSSPMWPLIEQVIRRHSVPKLSLWCYSPTGGTIPDSLYNVCPHVAVIPDHYPNPIEEWK